MEAHILPSLLHGRGKPPLGKVAAHSKVALCHRYCVAYVAIMSVEKVRSRVIEVDLMRKSFPVPSFGDRMASMTWTSIRSGFLR